MTDELRNCPFCDGKPEVVEQLEGFVIRCSNRNRCPILPQSSHFQYNAIAAFSFNWNTRSNPEAERLVEALKQSTQYLRSLPIDGDFTYEARQFAVQNEQALKDFEESGKP